MLISLHVLEDLIAPPKKEGARPKIVKKDMVSKMLFDTSKITPREVHNNAGKKLTDRCLVIDDQGHEYMVKHSFEAVCKMKGMIQVKGFRR